MWTVLLRILIIYQVTIQKGECFRPPDFRSAWLPLHAQGGPASLIDVQHGLGVVPDLVEVMVKVTGGDNKDFIFKAMGTGGKDDDDNNLYGRVMYFYNENMVRVMAPNRNNAHATGGAIYTGDSPFWTGVNYQYTTEALIQVKCWTSRSLPSPCFHSSGTVIQSGSTAGGNSYKEIHHNLGRYPDVMQVRAKMTNKNMVGWYCNAQGSVTGQYSNSANYNFQYSSGIIYGYSNDTVRVWASSHDHLFLKVDELCETVDGWEVEMRANEGLLEVTAWCDLGLPESNEVTVHLNASTTFADLEIHLPQPFTDVDNVLFSLMVRVNDGPNAEFLFEGVGGASSDTYNLNTSPCDYGGIIYAYSDSSIRMWMPNSTNHGAAVCISDGFGIGNYAQKAVDVTVIIKAREWQVLHPAVGPAFNLQSSGASTCGHFYRVGPNVSYSETLLGQQVSTSTEDCWRICHTDDVCTTFAFKAYTCKTYELFDESLLVLETGSEVWTIQI